MHGQISIKDGARFGVELCSIVGEIHAFTAKLQDSNTSALSLAELALQCHAFERRLNEFQDGDTDLVWAAWNGQTEVVRALIKDGTDVNAQDDGGDTALMVAVEFDQIEVVKYLIENGASLTATNSVGNSVLMTAAEKGHVILCQYLAQQPGTDVNATNKFGYTALTRAAANGDLQVVQNLAGQRGADVNAGSKNGLAALTMATLGGATDVVRYLAEDCGADVDCKAKNGDTLLMVAASAGHFDLVKYFVDYCGADVNVMNESGDTTLIRAAEGGHTNIVRLCLADYGADVNARNEGGNTALMKAAEKGRVDVVRCLLEQGGIDVDAKNQRGQTAFRLAHAYQEVRRMLTPFLPPRPQQRTGGVRASTRASISPSEFELVRFCETGNIGGEYRAKWLDADAVVKLFVPDASVTSFDEEVQLWQQLRHPNVMKMYGACKAPPNLQLFVCEYISHGTLIEHVDLASGEKPTVWKFLHEAALGLKYLHERGIMHGDLRCGNFLIGSDGLAKLSNFGLSGSMMRSYRGSSGVFGSMRWLASEILEGKSPSIASDVYSLGMCILEATTREQPWGCEGEQVAEKHKMQWAPEIKAYSFSEPECPPGDARKLVWQMCCKDESHRVTLSSVVDELERLAIAERSSFSQPEHEPASAFTQNESNKLNELWLEVHAHMDTCNNDKYRRLYDKANAIHERWQESGSRDGPTVLKQFHTFLAEFYRTMTISPEQASITLLTSSRATAASMTRSIRAWNQC